MNKGTKKAPSVMSMEYEASLGAIGFCGEAIRVFILHMKYAAVIPGTRIAMAYRVLTEIAAMRTVYSLMKLLSLGKTIAASELRMSRKVTLGI